VAPDYCSAAQRPVRVTYHITTFLPVAFRTVVDHSDRRYCLLRWRCGIPYYESLSTSLHAVDRTVWAGRADGGFAAGRLALAFGTALLFHGTIPAALAASVGAVEPFSRLLHILWSPAERAFLTSIVTATFFMFAVERLCRRRSRPSAWHYSPSPHQLCSARGGLSTTSRRFIHRYRDRSGTAWNV